MIHRYLVYRSGGPPEQEPPGRASWVRADARSVLTFFSHDPPRLRVFLSFLDGGCEGVVLHDDRTWLAYAWMSTPSSKRPGHLPTAVVPERACWIYFCRTTERARGRGLYKTALGLLVARAADRHPCAEVLVDTSASNIASRRAITAAGFAPCGVTLTLDVPGVGVWGRWFRGWGHP